MVAIGIDEAKVQGQEFAFAAAKDPSLATWAPGMPAKPFVDGAVTFVGGEVKPWAGELTEVTSPILDEATGKRAVIGSLAKMGEPEALAAVEAAAKAWDKGQGAWPQMAPRDRVQAVRNVMAALKARRAEMVDILMWEICKTAGDAAKEFDRTMDYADASMAAYEGLDAGELGQWTTVSGVTARVRRGPVGTILFLAPFNYPLNEMYAMLIPALLTGNTVVMKLPTIGGQCHVLTAQAFAEHLPAGAINFVSGSGRATCPAIMQSGLVDMLGFIGGSKAADSLILQHPAPHRLKVFSQLEGKNVGVVLPDADLDEAAEQCVLGALSYNGQRCTAIKLIQVHESVAAEFVDKLRALVAKCTAGLPWQAGVSITPLPEANKPGYLRELVADAVAKGASIVNEKEGGGALAGNLLQPPVLFPVTKEMRCFHEEQFGPVVPVAVFADLDEVVETVKHSWNGQQCALFTQDPEQCGRLIDTLATIVGRINLNVQCALFTQDPEQCGRLIDTLATIVGRINLNVQCARSPDVFPFSGRRSSAMGTMSVAEALRGFSVETVVAYSAKAQGGDALAQGAEKVSKFLSPMARGA